MTIEERAELEAKQKAEADAKAQDAEFLASLEGLSDEEKAQKIAERQTKGLDIKNEIDYEAEAKREKEAREKAEKATADIAFKLREEKRKKDEETGYSSDDTQEKPITALDLQAALDRQSQTIEKKLNETKVIELVGRLASSPAEADLVMEVFKSYGFPTHLSLEEQVEKAFAIANSKRLIGEKNELARALNNKGGVKSGFASGHSEGLSAPEPELSAELKLTLSNLGFAFNAITRRYEKKISHGKVLVYDLKTKRILPPVSA